MIRAASLRRSPAVSSLACVLTCALSLWSCNDIEMRPGCTEGRSEPCTCPGGASGSQTCIDGTHFGPCDCGDAGDVGTDVGDVAGDSGAVETMCEPNESYCEGREAFRCSEDGQVATSVATCDDAAERCRGGACVSRPAGYGEACDDAGDCPDTAPQCPNGFCVTRAPGAVSDPCWDELECEDPAPYCNTSADACQAGLPGEACDDDGDCATDICVAEACRAGVGGDPCDIVDGDDCVPPTPYCVDDDGDGPNTPECQAGIEGEPCVDLDDCAPAAPICATTGVCQDGTGGDGCTEDDDCAGATPLCGPDEVGCQAGVEGEPCADDDDCSVVAPICSASGICLDGSPSDPCVTDAECAERNCSNEHCAPEGYAYIPAGSFMMGSPPGEVGRREDETLHEVTITRPYLMAITEVTQGEWVDILGDENNPSAFPVCGRDCPVESVNWYEAVYYANELSAQDWLEACYEVTGCRGTAGNGLVCDDVEFEGLECEGYRLPTEAEWEQAARARTATPGYSGSVENPGPIPLDLNTDQIAWHVGNNSASYEGAADCSAFGTGDITCGPQPVGRKDSNGWGLYDTAGNVQEWVFDAWDRSAFASSASTDPISPNAGDFRVFRGGGWAAYAQDCRSAVRESTAPNDSRWYLGFRLVRLAPPSSSDPCDNGHLDGDETDVDCGGPTCTPCAEGAMCDRDDDCVDGTACSNGNCAQIGAVYVPPGTFWMGSPEDEDGRSDVETRHQVTLTRPFALQRTEVTQAAWSAQFDANPSEFDECGATCPVDSVNWWEALKYTNAMSESQGLPPCYELVDCNDEEPGEGFACDSVTVTSEGGNPYLCRGWRLPTEAEWEYAYRAGTETAFHNDGDITHTGYTPVDPVLRFIAWYGGNSKVDGEYEGGVDCSDWGVPGQSTCGSHPVGEKLPNLWGLVDMSGNVWEWVFDSWNETAYGSEPTLDPVSPNPGSFRVWRGGSWFNTAQFCRAAFRAADDPGYRDRYVGFRLARTIFPAHCSNGRQEPLETDVDCGGPCPLCGLSERCRFDPDCGSNHCSNSHCAPKGFAYIPNGSFWMGSPDGEDCPDEYPGDCTAELGREIDETLHHVTLTRPFYLAETEVTQGQWEAQEFTNPSEFDECGPNCPVETVNWWETAAYVNALSENDGLAPCYTLEGCDPSSAGTDIDCSGITVSDPSASGNPYDCEGYRLPMEAEWEYAYRAETTTAFYNGGISEGTVYSPLDGYLDLIGWYGGNSGVSYSPGYDCSGWYDGSSRCGTHEVGGKGSNDWGLFDMSGNVYEWVWDWYESGYYASSPTHDPTGGTGSTRVERGGFWQDFAPLCRAANRGVVTPGDSHAGLGFRPARSVPGDREE